MTHKPLSTIEFEEEGFDPIYIDEIDEVIVADRSLTKAGILAKFDHRVPPINKAKDKVLRKIRERLLLLVRDTPFKHFYSQTAPILVDQKTWPLFMGESTTLIGKKTAKTVVLCSEPQIELIHEAKIRMLDGCFKK